MARPVHFEFFSDDPEKAVAFYTEASGWRVEQWGDQPYWLLYTGEGGPGIDGAAAPTGDHGQKAVLTVGVDDLDDAVAKVKTAGGTVLSEKQPIPGVGWLAQARDPNGMYFGLMQEDPEAAA